MVAKFNNVKLFSRGRIRGKPPTPPPRERSRSPVRSERATPGFDFSVCFFLNSEQVRRFQSHNYRSHNGVHEPNTHDFSNLSSIVHTTFLTGLNCSGRRVKFGEVN
ncbi:hypothetical protein DICVIV_12063 [Dictyocaulus viviparus]|uniref:Uncharacterized protein n=1 Tax=Dictyocaulus viviparus TaxID=29172 RepID=A0A0D8XE69_DICVI|nr:hypothetical protein DICVIV_12063 [Dictyocaulus viviparus]